jgi:phage terminase small subunit
VGTHRGFICCNLIDPDRRRHRARFLPELEFPMRGRKPVPTKLKILMGTRSDQINFGEPSFAPVSTEVPGWIAGDDVASAHWAEMAPILQRAGLLTEADRNMLALLCESFARFRCDPANDKARTLYLRLATEFGMARSSRSRVKLTAEKSADSLQAFLDRKGSS